MTEFNYTLRSVAFPTLMSAMPRGIVDELMVWISDGEGKYADLTIAFHQFPDQNILAPQLSIFADSFYAFKHTGFKKFMRKWSLNPEEGNINQFIEWLQDCGAVASRYHLRGLRG